MRALEYQGRLRRKISVQPLGRRRILALRCQRASQKRFSRSPCQQWKAKRLQILKVRQQRIILLKVFPKAEARIERDSFAAHPGDYGRLDPLAQLALDLERNVARGRESPP